MSKKKILVTSVIICVTLLLVVILAIFLPRTVKRTKPVSKPGLYVKGVVSKNEASVLCGGKDTVCVAENGKVVFKKVSGKTLEYMRHFCDNPRNCPSPAPQAIQAATDAIRRATGEKDLVVTPIRGDAGNNITYYCAKDNRCWALENSTNRVLSLPK